MNNYKRLTERFKNGFVHYKCSKKDMKDCGLYYNCGECHKSTEALYRLAELEDKIEQGTLIELPCKVGDTVYVIYQYRDFLGTTDKPFIEEDIVTGFVYDENKMKIIPSNYAERNDYWYVVKDILFTREEAEKRLKEMQE